MAHKILNVVLLSFVTFGVAQRFVRPERSSDGFPFVDPSSPFQPRPNPNPYNLDNQFIDWATYKANGVNLGSWLEKERTHDPIWWVSVGGENVSDEWVSNSYLSLAVSRNS